MSCFFTGSKETRLGPDNLRAIAVFARDDRIHRTPFFKNEACGFLESGRYLFRIGVNKGFKPKKRK